MKKIMAMMITSDFDGWGGSHAGSVNTGMEIEEKLSGGSPPALSSGPLFRSCTALATSISQSTVYQSRLSDTRAILPAPNASVYPSLLL